MINETMEALDTQINSQMFEDEGEEENFSDEESDFDEFKGLSRTSLSVIAEINAASNQGLLKSLKDDSETEKRQLEVVCPRCNLNLPKTVDTADLKQKRQKDKRLPSRPLQIPEQIPPSVLKEIADKSLPEAARILAEKLRKEREMKRRPIPLTAEEKEMTFSELWRKWAEENNGFVDKRYQSDRKLTTEEKELSRQELRRLIIDDKELANIKRLKALGVKLFRCTNCGKVVPQDHYCRLHRIDWKPTFRRRAGVPVAEQLVFDQTGPRQFVIRKETAILRDQLEAQAAKIQEQRARLERLESELPMWKPEPSETTRDKLQPLDVKMTNWNDYDSRQFGC
jgi:phage FluMu protein Com